MTLTIHGPPLADVPCCGGAPRGGPVQFWCPVCGHGYHASELEVSV